MKHFIFCFFAILLNSNIGLFAQREVDVNWNPSKKDIAFYENRQMNSEPTFGLQKIKDLIKKEGKEPGNDEAPFEFNRGISNKSFKNLSVEEKFTYTMVHPELYSQACAEPLYMKQPAQKIFAQLLAIFTGEEWSERQMVFMREHKAEVLQLLRQSISQSNKMGLNYKEAYVRIDAWEAIPDIITFYKKNKKDRDVLTVLMLLMKNGQFADFVKSKSYSKLYGSDMAYDEWIVFNAANEKYILQTAEAYFKFKSQ